ncbi:MAG: SRPBCC domain-containing protein [Isosphaeraceae bacterium]
MSLRKDPDGRRWVQVEAEVPGTVEQVWAAIATGEGVSSWFVPTEKREDGTVVSSFGPGMESVARQTAWDPPRRFAAESSVGGPDAPKMATEWTLETRDGGTCVVRVVHSLFASNDDWDNQLEAIEKGWPDYFAILSLYLKHFAGRPCSGVPLMSITTGTPAEAWEAVAGPLGLAGAGVGERRESTGDAPRLAGVVERVGQAGHPHQTLLRLDEPAPGLVHLFTMGMGGMTLVSVRFFLFGEDARPDASETQAAWQSWLARLFPQPAPAAAPAC